MEPVALSVNEAAKALSVSRTTVYALLNLGYLEKIKIGTRTAITSESIQKFGLQGTQGAHLSTISGQSKNVAL